MGRRVLTKIRGGLKIEGRYNHLRLADSDRKLEKTFGENVNRSYWRRAWAESFVHLVRYSWCKAISVSMSG